ncbi:LytTR family transcriptional regulator DNA-binding domain-containing protein [Spirosoma sp. BT702]|uniref:LytTR family transcriptional regulator DNA-binding domain-containing protein n=1 Tax=Spirosoma profusum TaxID=2771354 RepID=A0A927GAD2_9BACT|nr:LytTR family DNA-binding domain-containing protein [Spirosoma profusum]MBD2705487.1 LytTR family transcriptional regulator DNA-binding domain-containing protein [Spirosoma profusum]
MALTIVVATNDTPFSRRLFLPSFYTDILFAVVFTYLFGWYVRTLTTKLNQRFPSLEAKSARIWQQIIWGIVFPLAILLLLEMAYIQFALGISPNFFSLFGAELPLAATYMVVLNGLHYQTTATQSGATSEHISIPQKRPATTFLVTTGYKQKPIPVRDIAYFISTDKVVYLVTDQAEQYLVQEPLNKLIERVDPRLFFKMNRQMIAHRNSIECVEHTATRKLLVTLRPPIAMPMYVSKERVSLFLTWLNE